MAGPRRRKGGGGGGGGGGKSSSKDGTGAGPAATKGSSTSRLAIVAAIVALVCGSAYVLVYPSSPGPSEPFKPKIIGTVERVVWDENTDFVELVKGRRTPLIIENSVIKQWAAFEKWTPEFLLDKIHTMWFVKNGTNNEFTLENKEKPLKFRNFAPVEYKMVNVSYNDFYAQREASDYFLYYSGPLSDWQDDLMNDVAPMDKFVLPNTLGQDLGAQNLWIGHAGVKTRCHYDRSLNFFIQVSGRKHWYLFPPDQWENLYPYPSIHMRYEQAQFDIASPDFKRFPNARNLEAYEVEVGPGDLMWNPPFWFHQVTALDYAISLSFLNPSEEEIIYGDVYWTELPFEAEWTRPARLRAVVTYLTKLIVASGADVDAGAFVKRVLVNNRYHDFYPGILMTASLERELKATECYTTKASAPMAVAGFGDRVDPIVRDVAAKLRQLSPDALVINLGNLAEELMLFAVGVDNVGAAFVHCF